MITYNEYLKNILVQVVDSYNVLKEINDNPGDLDNIKKEMLKINGFLRVVLKKSDTEKIPTSDFKTIKTKFQHYLDAYSFEKEIETMTSLYSNDVSRIKNMRLKILDVLEDKNMISSIRELIEKI